MGTGQLFMALMPDLKFQIETRDGPGCFLCRSLPVRRFYIHPEQGDDLGNLVAMCGVCRGHLDGGCSHRESRMDRHRWVTLSQRQRSAGYARPQRAMMSQWELRSRLNKSAKAWNALQL